MLGSSESRRRKKDPDRERDRERSSPKSKDKDRDRERNKDKDKEYRKSRSSRTSGSRKPKTAPPVEDVEGKEELAPEITIDEPRRTSSTSAPKPQRVTAVPEMERRGSLGVGSPYGSANGSRTSLSYPSFSKTHSKENIYSREGTPKKSQAPNTPEPTDLGEKAGNAGKRMSSGTSPMPPRAPPSPPLTATTGADLRKTASINNLQRKHAETEAVHQDMAEGRRSVDSGTRMTPEPRSKASRSSIRVGEAETDLTSTTSGAGSTVRGKSPNVMLPRMGTSSPASARPASRVPSTTIHNASRQASELTQSTDSDATSVPPDHQAPRARSASPTNSEASPASIDDSSPRTPTQPIVVMHPDDAHKLERPPTVEIFTDFPSRSQSVDSAAFDSPLTPPPPPPPPTMLTDPPRVDYLLQNGGLTRTVPRSLLAAADGTPVSGYSQYIPPGTSEPQIRDARPLFQPLQRLLDDYNAVLDTNGSLAVATGYRSVARRLLDRLEAVFARNISSEQCQCLMCVNEPMMEEERNGVNWGEILELVSGRCDLPQWPPIEHAETVSGPEDLAVPCQRIDVDVPEKFREHYAQQSRKTKVAVQSWLSTQTDAVPEDADDETLTFAMLTRLEPSQRPLFYALLYGMNEMPTPRSKPDTQTTPTYITKAALAIQRLYRLYTTPRSQLVVMYLIRYPDKHNMLATLSAVTNHEWDILVSGRFDGFLWSGAETIPDISSPPPRIPRGPSRGPSGTIPLDDGGPRRFATPLNQTPYTPFSPGPSPRPGSARPGSTRPPGPAPVRMDEDTEVAVLAEVEREIFLSMEAMEDAFEKLHLAAENVRRRLRERGAALSMVAQARRGSGFGGIEVRMDTPAGVKSGAEVDQECIDELRSEIGPDDSASNVSHNRRRRGHRTRERRTPAPVEEGIEEEEDVELGLGAGIGQGAGQPKSTLAERIRRKF